MHHNVISMHISITKPFQFIIKIYTRILKFNTHRLYDCVEVLKKQRIGLTWKCAYQNNFVIQSVHICFARESVTNKLQICNYECFLYYLDFLQLDCLQENIAIFISLFYILILYLHKFILTYFQTQQTQHICLDFNPKFIVYLTWI